MFTTGSKLYFGATALAVLGAIVYGIGSGWEIFGVMVLATFAVAAAFLGGMIVAFRDNTVPAAAADELAGSTATLASPNSPWPMLGAVSAAVTAVGAALDTRLFYIGAALLVAVALEWVVQGWADRASADRGYNNALRGRLVHALEFPVLGALAVGFVIFTFSRLMLAINENAAIVAFVAIGAIVVVAAVLLGRAQRISRPMLGSVVGVFVAAMVAVGVVGLARGEHKVELDSEKTSNAVANKSNQAAVIRFDNGAVAVQQGVQNPAESQIILPKANESGLLFRQGTKGKHRFVIEAIGPEKQADGTRVDKPVTFQTDFIDEGKTAYLGVRLVRSGTFTFKVESEDGTAPVTGKVIVP